MSIFDKLREANVDADMQSSKPIFYKLSLQSDIKALEAIIESKKPIVHDEILGQVQELVKLRNPTKKIPEYELTLRAQEYINSNGAEAFGVWVYYPWSNRLIRILEEEEFIEVRTNRNKNKITDSEQRELSQKKVGVVGLSVGQSVALTMAMERSFGELRIADFDKLELTNLNRIRSSVVNLGLKKTVVVAREIAEVDPYLKISLFNSGVTESNIDSFITQDGVLDMIIEECDSFNIKVLVREKAKSLNIPVLMDTSDSGMLDVERFDIEPDRPLFHGLISHLDKKEIHEPGDIVRKLGVVLPVLGRSTASTRMKSSILEVGKSLSTWPQLASAVISGGGICADAYRKIVLGQAYPSGRYHFSENEFLPRCSFMNCQVTNRKGIISSIELTHDDIDYLNSKIDLKINSFESSLNQVNGIEKLVGNNSIQLNVNIELNSSKGFESSSIFIFQIIEMMLTIDGTRVRSPKLNLDFCSELTSRQEFDIVDLEVSEKAAIIRDSINCGDNWESLLSNSLICPQACYTNYALELAFLLSDIDVSNELSKIRRRELIELLISDLNENVNFSLLKSTRINIQEIQKLLVGKSSLDADIISFMRPGTRHTEFYLVRKK